MLDVFQIFPILYNVVLDTIVYSLPLCFFYYILLFFGFMVCDFWYFGKDSLYIYIIIYGFLFLFLNLKRVVHYLLYFLKFILY